MKSNRICRIKEKAFRMLTMLKSLGFITFSLSVSLMMVLVSPGIVDVKLRANSLDSATDKIVFAMSPDDSGISPDEIFTMNSDGSNLVQLTVNDAEDYAPVWSPDLTKIAFLSNRNGNAFSEIYVMNADGSSPTRLTNNNSADLDLDWVGNHITFTSNREGDPEIYVMNDDGSNQVNLTNNIVRDIEPAWSPNGDRIAFISDRDGFLDLYVMNADGSSPTRLTFVGNNDSRPSFPAWSPTGNMIAFRSGTGLDLYRIDADGTNLEQITFGEAGVISFGWLANGNQIAFKSGSSIRKGLYTINIDGSNRTLLDLNWPPDALSFSVPAVWQPDFAPVSTPTPTTTPSSNVFPTAGVLDNFNRADGAIGGNWIGAPGGYGIASNHLDVGSGGAIYWNPATFGADQEAFVTLTNPDPSADETDLLLKYQFIGQDYRLIEVWYQPTAGKVQVWTHDPTADWVQYGADIPVTFAAGDQFGARAKADGTVEVYKNGTLLASRDLNGWTYYADGGAIGLWMINASDALLDDFGGGDVP